MKTVATVIALSVASCSQPVPPPAAHQRPPVFDLVADRGGTSVDVGPGHVRSSCPSGMVEVAGDYCPKVEEACLYAVDLHGNKIKGDGKTGRCGEWQSPSKCLSKTKQHLHFCIDRYEFPNIEGQRPQSWMSYHSAKAALVAVGKRLCTDIEWTFAAEGPNMQPYPYGDGYHRDVAACNFDNTLHGLDVFKARKHTDLTAQALDAMLQPSGAMSDCVSPFGVHDMAGNIDEVVENVSGHGRPYQSYLKGGHIFGVRNASRPATEAHNEDFSWYEVGSRGCKDVL